MHMPIDDYLTILPYDAKTTQVPKLGDDSADPVLEGLIHGKSDMLAKKLDILASEIKWRLYLASGNLKRLDEDQEKLTSMIERLDRDANYQMRDHQEKAPLYRQLFAIQGEKRSQPIECWRDVIMVMRDFLGVWEAHQLAQNRATFIENVGTRP
jgi:hypothetical protein